MKSSLLKEVNAYKTIELAQTPNLTHDENIDKPLNS